jgi:DNA polymerase-3 subunit epsilon
VTLWHDGRLVAYDSESTGVDVETARIVTATFLSIASADDKRETNEVHFLVNPGVDIPAEATAIHSITTEQARAEGVDPVGAIVAIRDLLANAWSYGVPVIGHNIVYDFTLLDRELRRYGLPPLQVTGPVVDTLVLDKALDRYRKGKRTLVAACEHYQVVLGEAHTSQADALAAARLAWRLMRHYPELRALSLADLHDAQVRWFATQAEGLAAYFARQGKAEHVDTHWPLRPVPVAAVAS